MDEKKMKKGFITKETIIAAIIGLIVGVGIMFLVAFLMDYFATSAGIAKFLHGDETVATIDGKAIKSNELYESAKKTYGLKLLMNEADNLIINDMYQLTKKEEEEVQELADYYIKYYSDMGYTEQKFLEEQGFANYQEFLDDIRLSKKTNKYLYDYLEGKLEEGAVQKYYDENKDTIETYDSEHMLVKISDTVTDEQALALANEIIGKLNEGKSFEEVKNEYADRITYEELGYQGKSSNLQQTYIDELVALQDGAYSQVPVKTTYGYHVVHKIATATLEDLRPTIIETLSEDLLSDQYVTDKAFIELRDEKKFTIHDETINKSYENYRKLVYETQE